MKVKNETSTTTNYISDLVSGLRNRQARLTYAIRILEMSDAAFSTFVSSQSVATTTKTRGRKKGSKNKTTATNGVAQTGTAISIPVTGAPEGRELTANEKRSLAQKARWAKVKGTPVPAATVTATPAA